MRHVFKGRRSQLIIASKVGVLPSSLGRIAMILLRILQPVRHLIQPLKDPLKNLSESRQDFSSKHIKQSIEKSLPWLLTDYLDLYQLHNPPKWLLERGEVFETLEHLKDKGKIRFSRVSAVTVRGALICLKYSKVSSLQVILNLSERQAAKKVLPLAQQKKLLLLLVFL